MNAPDVGEKIDLASSRLERAVRTLAGYNTGNQSTVHINASGIGVWFACIACAFMLGCNVFLLGLYLDQQAQLRNLNEYISAIYMMAPQLKPEKKK